MTIAKKQMKTGVAELSAQTAARVKRLARVLDALHGAPCAEQDAVLRAAIELIQIDRLGSISERPS